MILTVFKALPVGVIAAIPIGPILVMVIQRTTCYGRRCGLMVGLGATMVDMMYAAIGLMAVQSSMISSMRTPAGSCSSAARWSA